jgi:hypothetical protein
VKFGNSTRKMRSSGEGVLLVKWAIEGSPYHLSDADSARQAGSTPHPAVIYLIAAGSVPLIVLFALLYFRHMRRINQELVSRYQESDRKRRRAGREIHRAGTGDSAPRGG